MQAITTARGGWNLAASRTTRPPAPRPVNHTLTLPCEKRGMFGKYQAVFRSRWRAVMWSMGVLLTAYCTVPGEHEGSNAGEIAALAAIAGQQADKPDEKPRHVNPWALHPEAAPSSGG